MWARRSAWPNWKVTRSAAFFAGAASAAMLLNSGAEASRLKSLLPQRKTAPRGAVFRFGAVRRSVRGGIRRMGVAVFQLVLGRLAHFADAHVEMQRLAGHRVVHVHVDGAHAHLVHGDRALAAFLHPQHGDVAGLEAVG